VTDHAAAGAAQTPLFPLHAVLFPGGLLGLKVFEARYVDLVAACLREQRPFGVVALNRGAEVRARGEKIAFEAVGTLAELIDVDGGAPGILQVRCRGTRRFRIEGGARQQADGLWVAATRPIADDEPLAPPEAYTATVKSLARAIGALKNQGSEPFLAPYRFDDAGWVANRWCELLPIPAMAKQRLMELPDALVRLKLVDEYLRANKVLP
jgi:Lon protease-like protein